MGIRALVVLCGLCIAAAGVGADFGLQGTSGLEFAPRFTRVLKQDVSSVASYLLPTRQPELCAINCCQADSYASPYGLTARNSTQQIFGGRTYTTFFYEFHSNHPCNSALDKAGCCTASADNVWIDVDPTLKVKYVSFNNQRLANAEQNEYGLKLGSINLQTSQAKTGIPLAITVEGAADALCPPPGLVPLPGLCEFVVQGGTAANPEACCPSTITVSSSTVVAIPANNFQCAASLDNSPFKLQFDGVSASGQQFLVYNFRLIATDSCHPDGVTDCCNAQLSYLDLKVTDLLITAVHIDRTSVGFTTSSWNEPNSASYRSLLVENINLVADDLGSAGLPLTVTVRLPTGAAASSVDLCDASSDPQQGACHYYLHSEDGFCCPSGLALPSISVPPPPAGTCSPTQVVPVAETSMSLQYYERIASAATTTFAFLLANHNPSSGCTKNYCVDVCSWTLYLDPAVASQVAVGHENPVNNGRQIITGGSPASLTFTYGPAGESTSIFYVTMPAGGKYLTDLCARNALPGQGSKPCGAVIRSDNIYVMVYFDDSEIIIVPGATSPSPPPVQQICSAPKPLSESCLNVGSARYNTQPISAVFAFAVAPFSPGTICQPASLPGQQATVHLLLSPATVDQLTTRKMVRPTTGLQLDRYDGARWGVSTTDATSLTFQVQGSLGMSEVCRQGVNVDQPAGTCVVEVSGDSGCFRGYVAATADSLLTWVEGEVPSGKKADSAIVPAVAVPVAVLVLGIILAVVWYRRRKNTQYYFMNSGNDDLDRPLASQSASHTGTLRDDISMPSATASDVHIRVPGASQGGVEHTPR